MTSNEDALPCQGEGGSLWKCNAPVVKCRLLPTQIPRSTSILQVMSWNYSNRNAGQSGEDAFSGRNQRVQAIQLATTSSSSDPEEIHTVHTHKLGLVLSYSCSKHLICRASSSISQHAQPRRSCLLPFEPTLRGY